MERSTVDSKYKWDVNTLYKDNKSLKNDYNKINLLTNNIVELKGKITLSYENFFNYIKWSEKASILEEKIGLYLYNTESQDTKNTESTKKILEYSSFIEKQNTKLYFVNNELLKNKNKIMSYLTGELTDYNTSFKKFFRSKKHKLTDNEEKLISEISPVFGSTNKLFNAMTSTDFNFGKVLDSKKNEFQVTQGNYYNLYTSDDKTLRKNSYFAFWNKYYDFKNTLAINYYYNVVASCKIAKIYKYESSLQASLFSNNLTVSFYDNLLDSCKSNSNLVLKWQKLKSKILKNNNPKPWDSSMPLFSLSNKKFSIEESKIIINKALKAFGTDYIKKLNYVLENNCIDYMPNIGKRQGAYSYGTYNSKPYICMNWNEKYIDLSTLIHEIGHSIHSMYSNENQPYQYHNYPIFLAEIASIVNEFMLIEYFLKNDKNDEFKKVVLEKGITEFIATVYRQLQFAEYEKWSHETVESGNSFTISDIIKKCNELQIKYFPKPKTYSYTDKYDGLWGIYVPHFYRDFYVFQYAVGMICASIIVSNIYENTGYEKKYIEFLGYGCRYFPLDALKKIGIDLNDKKTIQKAYHYLDSLINRLEKNT